MEYNILVISRARIFMTKISLKYSFENYKISKFHYKIYNYMPLIITYTYFQQTYKKKTDMQL